MRTSTSTLGTRTRARLVLTARPNHPVSLRYQVRTYTSPTTCTTQIGVHGRSVPSARCTAMSSSRAASTRASCSGVQLMILRAYASSPGNSDVEAEFDHAAVGGRPNQFGWAHGYMI